MEKSWEFFVNAANNIRQALDYKPSECKIGYQCSPGGILNAYREGDLDFQEAYNALEKWSRNSQDNIERNDSAELIGAFKHKGKLAVYLSDRKELEELPKTPTNNESHAIAFIQKELPIMIAQVGKVDRTSVQFIKGAINFVKKVLATAGIS